MSELTYEEARDELVALVARIESGKVPLEEAMLLWERGEQLAGHCQAKLDAAQETLDRAGTPSPVDEDQSSGQSARPVEEADRRGRQAPAEPDEDEHG